MLTICSGVTILASSGAAFLYAKGHGTSLFRDWLRLALIAFLINSALWSLMGFIATLINTDTTTPCQIVIVFAFVFDQLARVSLEQFLLGGMKAGFATSSGTLILQGVIAIRFILGGVLVGVQRPQIKHACISSNLLLPLGIATLAIDIIIVMIAFAGVINAGGIRKMREGSLDADRSRALIFVMAGFAIWTAVCDSLDSYLIFADNILNR